MFFFGNLFFKINIVYKIGVYKFAKRQKEGERKRERGVVGTWILTFCQLQSHLGLGSKASDQRKPQDPLSCFKEGSLGHKEGPPRNKRNSHIHITLYITVGFRARFKVCVWKQNKGNNSAVTQP